MRLEGRTVVVGITGGIACYKACDVVRLLVTAGARVRVVMTAGAREFVTPLTLQTLSGHPVATDTFSLTEESEIGHIRLADAAEVVVIAPATANVLGKLAGGIADDLLTTVLLATRAPLVLAPAMNVHMWEHPAVQENVARLAARGVRIVGPASGSLACGYEGAGRLVEPDVLVEEILRVLAPQDLAGQHVLVTAGPTEEPIDPVRYVSNRSSGAMGYRLAEAARDRGARVILVSGPTALAAPHGVNLVAVRSAEEMQQAVAAHVAAATVVIAAAAVSDYRPAQASPSKLKKRDGPLGLELVRTPDILKGLGESKGGRLLVGFAAETEDLVANARRKLEAKNLDLIVANDVAAPGAGFGVATNTVVLLRRDGRSRDVPLATKREVAEEILDEIVALKAGARVPAPA